MTTSTPSAARPRELTGRHVLWIALGAFAVIVTANMAMVIAATGSFPGLVAKNSYVASQDFDVRAERQRALGWTAAVDLDDETLTVRVVGPDGWMVRGLDVEAVVGRPAGAATDRHLTLREGSDGYVAETPLSPGWWRVALVAQHPADAGAHLEATTKIWVD